VRQRRTYEVDDAVGQSKCTSSLDAPPNILNLCLLRPLRRRLLGLFIEGRKILARNVLEARHDFFTHEILDGLYVGPCGHLDLELAFAEAEGEEFFEEVGDAGFGDHVFSSDSDANIAFCYEAWDVGGGEEDAKCDSGVKIRVTLEKRAVINDLLTEREDGCGRDRCRADLSG
jgi:hypothetical protein